jgi:Flp pilus assembly protein CpaB
VKRTSSPPPLPSHLLLAVRARRVLGRAVARRVAVVVVTAVTGVFVASLAGAAADQPPTVTRSVVVASRDLAPGEVVDASAVALRDVPTSAVAEAATSRLPVGSVVRYPIAEGEPVVTDRLAPEGLTGAAALVPEGHRAVALPLGPATAPPVHPGDRVDIVTFAPDLSLVDDGTFAEPEPDAAEPGTATGATGPAVALATNALVVDATDTTTTVAVPTPTAPSVAWAATQGLIALTLVGA